MTARQAARAAAAAGVGKLVLTHRVPPDHGELALEQAGEEFGGEIILAQPGLVVTI